MTLLALHDFLLDSNPNQKINLAKPEAPTNSHRNSEISEFWPQNLTGSLSIITMSRLKQTTTVPQPGDPAPLQIEIRPCCSRVTRRFLWNGSMTCSMIVRSSSLMASFFFPYWEDTCQISSELVREWNLAPWSISTIAVIYSCHHLSLSHAVASFSCFIVFETWSDLSTLGCSSIQNKFKTIKHCQRCRPSHTWIYICITHINILYTRIWVYVICTFTFSYATNL